MRQATAILLALSSAGLACNGTDFSKQSSKAPTAADQISVPRTSSSEGTPPADGVANPIIDSSSTAFPSSSPSPGLDCQNGVTQAKLLSPSVSNGKAGNYIEYQITLVDCRGAKKVFTAESILFDVDASGTGIGAGTPLQYSLSSDAGQVTGSLLETGGSDLFGNKGPTYYHNRTDKQVTVSTSTLSVKLRVEFGGRTFYPVGTKVDPSLPALLAYTLPTYLGVGKATPVRKDVLFN